MMKTHARALAFVLTLTLLLGAMSFTFSVNAKEPVTVTETGVTYIILADAYESITSGKGGGTIYLETKLGPAYFDAVRIGDTLTLKVNVAKADTYQWCMVTGWAQDVVNGTFTLLIDDVEADTLVN